ncbi:uncharacterized protein [Elaeis guineensis]|uniref:Uncharacterized protein LOC105046976 n=1 Tax=Elaeis guineensis var. tenera TaxID=51953 RepID=A0A6I9RJ32_ELAGV|nr:uncharacterized protein LOC105046976 [Elaeis guineensis]
MGNYISCAISAVPGGRSRAIKVILPSGDVRRIVDGTANVAELMLDTPGHFLVNSRSMQLGRRFAALSADEDLEMGEVFVMMPMKRLNSIVMAADMARLFLAANKEVRKSRVLPESSSSSSSQGSPANPVVGPELDDAGNDVNPMAMGTGEFKYRLSMRRSRKPTLETIAEEAIGSR